MRLVKCHFGRSSSSASWSLRASATLPTSDRRARATTAASAATRRRQAAAPSATAEASQWTRTSPGAASSAATATAAGRRSAPSGAGTVAEWTRTGSAGAGADDAMLSAWWRRQRSERGSRVQPDSESVRRLSGELEAFATSSLPSKEVVTQKDEFLRRLQNHLADVIDGAEVSPFGSVVNGFWTANSDLDICVRVPGASTRNKQIEVLKRIAAELSQFSSHHIEPRFGAQVPILHWAPQRPGMVSCDISINNVLAVVNSRLIGQYVKLDNRLRTLGLCVKAWTQARGINDRSRGTISSFALVMMLIHFLQRRDPPALPSLQDIAFSRSQAPMYVAGVDCRYCTNPSDIQQELEYLRGSKLRNQENVGFLLLEFLRYFGHEYRHGVIRIRDTRSLLPPVDESACYLVVDNPFEVGKDVANVDESQHDNIRKEFRRAWRVLSQGRPFRDVLRGGTIEEVVAKQQPLAWAGNKRPEW